MGETEPRAKTVLATHNHICNTSHKHTPQQMQKQANIWVATSRSIIDWWGEAAMLVIKCCRIAISTIPIHWLTWLGIMGVVVKLRVKKPSLHSGLE